MTHMIDALALSIPRLPIVPTRGVVYGKDFERLRAITDEAYREQLLQVKAAAIEAHRAQLALLEQGRGK
jgi:hypothetical protein